MTVRAEVTRKMQDLLPSVLLILTEASRREDIAVFAIHMSAMDGVSVFTGSAGAREHLANILGLDPKVHETAEQHLYRSTGEDAPIVIRVYGRDVR